MIVAGVDGCPGGQWVAALVDTDRRTPVWRLLGPDPAELLGLLEESAYAGIDVPIGLADAGPRQCDVAARRALGPRGSSVFPAPVRPVLRAGSHAEACALGRAVDGRGISVQCWHIVSRIRAVDSVVTPAVQSRLAEVHPELSFRLLAGGDLGPKRLASGRAARVAALSGWLPDVAALVSARPRPARADDALDALAVAWSVRRWARGAALVLPEQAARDARGLLMRIVA